MDVYEGGIPTGNSALWPKVKLEGEETQSYGGEFGIKTTKGSAPEANGKMTKDFLDDKGYHASMDVDNEPSLKVVNPDDIK